MTAEDDDIVYIGGKDIGRYVVAVKKQLEMNDAVHVKGRGREFVGKAVDVVELVKRDEEVVARDIGIDTNTDGEQKSSVIDLLVS